MLDVLIVGASGVFGSRLARLAAQERDVRLHLGGRLSAPLERLAKEIGGDVSLLDRKEPKPDDLAGIDLLIDCAGPFQGSDSALLEAAIAVGVDYIDLADGRDWVVGFEQRWDEIAKRKGVRAIAGASSIPALSHAAVDEMVRGWHAIDDLWIGIFPGNRAPRGRSVVDAILSYVGQPVRVLKDSKWQSLPGWGDLHRVDCGPAGKRWASICDTPEQDLLVRRYRPRRSAQFFAGLELPLLHVGLWLMSLPVWWGWIKSLRPLAGPMLAIAERFRAFGSDKGAMVVRASGIDRDGDPVSREWMLHADANQGPNVPIIAALLLVRRWRDAKRPPPGALPCSGLLSLENFEWDFARLGLRHSMSGRKDRPAFARAA
ncbi:saccharopine dehydrogenase family protein [Sphingomicrobium marinum]|uniref:saccharopine dehydrogenase family protein n=1 Tax=Sphingomicrobium marinum TaxID=1227950 RepID=UPI0022402B03|nr:saccharopine dehydrogenase NADP-binding domain-containing protein [Sphingomicrobium marinum]